MRVKTVEYKEITTYRIEFQELIPAEEPTYCGFYEGWDSGHDEFWTTRFKICPDYNSKRKFLRKLEKNSSFRNIKVTARKTWKQVSSVISKMTA